MLEVNYGKGGKKRGSPMSSRRRGKRANYFPRSYSKKRGEISNSLLFRKKRKVCVLLGGKRRRGKGLIYLGAISSGP